MQFQRVSLALRLHRNVRLKINKTQFLRLENGQLRLMVANVSFYVFS